MPFDIHINSHSSGTQNIGAGPGPQSNLHGTGTQSNYYGCTGSNNRERCTVNSQSVKAFQGPSANDRENLSEEKEDCLRSLSYVYMNTRRQNIEDAHPNTCEWLFNTTEFQEWRDRQYLSTHNGVLWIKGKPGAGKSTLMNHALSYFETVFADHIIVAYFFNARGGILEKTPLGMMRSIVYQLLNKNDALYGRFVDSYREKRRIHDGKDLKWQQEELKKFIQSIVKWPLQSMQSKPLLVLVDALDECDEGEVRDVVGFLEILSVNAITSRVKLRICLSSRHYPRISMRKNLNLTIELRQEHRNDIATYLEGKLLTDHYSIKKQVQDKAGGIFLWVVLVVAMLNRAEDDEDLEELFDTLVAKGVSDRAELMRVLQWVLLSRQPLTPEELYIAAVSGSLPSHTTIRRRIISSSKGLVEVRNNEAGREIVQFIHLSVNDFLYRNKRLERLDSTLEPDAISASHARLWAYCRSYIISLDTLRSYDAEIKLS
ncbi:hypothetical protein F4678DRAFT_467061 [Xylaria arbuscula]|nr:hypothetical protein F4678DRAFT_467061 [Xylaria arbuscula]